MAALVRTGAAGSVCARSAVRQTRGLTSTTTATSITSSPSAAVRIVSIATTRARFATSLRRSASSILALSACRLRPRRAPRRGATSTRMAIPISIIGFADPTIPAKVYRNDAKGTQVRRRREGAIGVELNGVARQPAWIDYDGDGDLDLFAAFRDVPNRLLRNDRGRFVDVTEASGNRRSTQDGQRRLVGLRSRWRSGSVHREPGRRGERPVSAGPTDGSRTSPPRWASAGMPRPKQTAASARAWPTSIGMATSICSSPIMVTARCFATTTA